MLEMQIARNAFGAFYGATFSVLVGAEVYDRLSALLPSDATVFILRSDGLIDLPPTEEEPRDSDASPVPLVGMAIGLKIGIFDGKRAAAADALLAHCTKHNMNELPAVHLMARWDVFAVRKAIVFFANTLAERYRDAQEHQGKTQRQLAELRGRYERLWLSFEKARRMIQGAGYSLRSVSFSLMPGDDVVGPTAITPEPRYLQLLPDDLAGFAGVNVYVTKLPSVDAKGVLTVRIRRRADDVLIGQTDIRYSDIVEGWTSCSFEQLMPLTHGDGTLEVIWTGDGGPQLALADIDADRYGDKAGRTLALQIEKGLLDPTLETSRLVNRQPLECIQMSGHVLVELGQYLGGSEELERMSAALNNNAVSSSTKDGWMQTHMAEEGPVGWRLPVILNHHTKNLGVNCITGHAMGPPSLYMVVAASPETPDAEILAVLEKIGQDEGLSLEGANDAGEIFWSAAVGKPTEPLKLQIEFPEALSERTDVVLAVRSLNGSNAYGHAQWLSLESNVEANSVSKLKPHSEATLMAGRERIRQIRRHRLAELTDQITFYQGRAELTAISESLGFSPMVVSEDTGALQTHPYQGKISAGILARGMPVGAQRLSCEVGTAHATAPPFTYVLGVLPPDTADKRQLVEEMVARVVAGEMVGHDSTLGMYWSALTLEAQNVRTLALELEDHQDRMADVVFAAVAATDIDSYGWCRWYSFEVVMAADGPSLHSLERPIESLVKAS